MTKIINFGRHQLSVSLNRRPGRPRKTPSSRIFRHLFENKKVRQVLGLNLTAVVFLTGVTTTPISALSGNPATEITANPAIIQLTTDHSVRLPVETLHITQGYHFFHPGVDLAEEAGLPVYPIMDGRVEAVFYDRFAYGNHILVDHGSGFKSFYAHLAKIVVKENQEVDRNTVIGTVGSTGRSTGPHLHLEVYDNGRPFNPLTILK